MNKQCVPRDRRYFSRGRRRWLVRKEQGGLRSDPRTLYVTFQTMAAVK